MSRRSGQQRLACQSICTEIKHDTSSMGGIISRTKAMAASRMSPSARWSPHKKSIACRRFFHPRSIGTKCTLVHLPRRTGTLVSLLVLLVNPSFAKIKTFVGDNVDMSVYKTYRWLPPRVLTNTGILEDDPNVAPA